MAKNVSEINPFDFASTTTTESNVRKLDHTAMLISTSRARAISVIKTVKDGSLELKELANKMMIDGIPSDLISLINLTITEDDIKEDAKLLSTASEEELSRLLESRRSDRSKLKAKGLRTSLDVTTGYIAAMYAELLVREAWNKPYAAADTTVFDSDDQDAIKKKIKSLQSKKCRLAKTAEYVPADKVELEATVEEINRLSALRPTGSITSKTIIKSEDAELIRAAIANMNIDELPADQQEAFKRLMAI